MGNIKLFAYGTLCDPNIQTQLFGCELPCLGKASLHHYKRYDDQQYPYIKPETGAKVAGKVYLLTSDWLTLADAWEEVPLSYKRVEQTIVLHSSERLRAWVYIQP